MDVCYIIRSGNVQRANEAVPCTNSNGVRQCCGRNHTCGAQGFCHFTNQAIGTVSGYYLGGCTDSTFMNSICPQSCKSLAFQDVVYNTTSGSRACCVMKGTINCADPSDERFAAPAAAELFASRSSSSSAATASIPTARTVTGTATSVVPSATSSTPASDTTNPAAKVPASTIVTATLIPISVILIIAGIIIYWRRKRSPEHAKPHAWTDKYAEWMYEPIADKSQRFELATQAGANSRSELDSTSEHEHGHAVRSSLL